MPLFYLFVMLQGKQEPIILTLNYRGGQKPAPLFYSRVKLRGRFLTRGQAGVVCVSSVLALESLVIKPFFELFALAQITRRFLYFRAITPQ